MNQYVPSIANKRVPAQYHLSLHTDSTYKGLPVLNCPGGLVSEYLDRLYKNIHAAIQKHSRTFAVRVDLHFPKYYSPLGQEVLSNQYLGVFVKALRRRLQRYKKDKQRRGYRVHDVKFDYIWVRESGPESGKPHFHLLLLFNGHAFNTLGRFSDDCESLYNRIGEAWAEALGLHASEGVKYLYIPSDGRYMVQSECWEQLADLFRRASYLAKVATKNFHDGCHVCGGNRI